MIPIRSHHFRISGIAIFTAITVASLSIRAKADPPSPLPLSDQAHDFLRVDLARKILQSPLSLAVKNSTLDDVIDRVQRSLLIAHSSPTLDIQVRNVRPVRLSFMAKNSTAGSVLSSAALLAGARLWVFGSHLVIAPLESLTPEERSLQEKHLGEGRAYSSNDHYDMDFGRESIYKSFLIEQLKFSTPQGGPPNAANPLFGFSDSSTRFETRVAFSQLSPDQQAMVQELVTRKMNDYVCIGLEPNTSRFDLTPNSMLALDSQRDGGLLIATPGQNYLFLSRTGNGWQKGKIPSGATPPSALAAPSSDNS